MTRLLWLRLSLMMFLEYAVLGAVMPILSLYLKSDLGFTALEFGVVMAMPPLAALVVLFVAAHATDRWVSAERFLALCHFGCALVMLVIYYQTTFPAFVTLYFVYGLLITPTLGLTNAVALHHVKDVRKEFGGIRASGTLGWVVVAWTFGYLWLRGGGGGSRLQHALVFSAAVSLVLGAYALTLPRSSVDTAQVRKLSPRKALRVFARPSLVLLCVATVAYSVAHQFYYYGMSPFLSGIGMSRNHIMPVMSLGQISEIAILALLGLFLVRLSIKQAIVIGALFQAFRFFAFALGGPMALIVAAISTHGVCYAFFFTTAYLYVDTHSRPEERGSAQQLFTIMIAGCGNLAGFLIAGWTGRLTTIPATGQIDFTRLWLVPMALALAIALVMLLFFREEPRRTETSPVA